MIQPGQIYRSCDPRGGPRIRITAYRPGDARAQVVDADNGKRLRQILVKDLHDSPVTATGRRRRSGYVLDGQAPAVPENAHDGPQERPEGGFAAPALREGQNGPQTGADGFGGGQGPRGPIDWARRQQAEREAQQAARHENDLRKLIAGAIRDTPAHYPDDIADAVWRVIQPHLDPELRRQLDDAIAALGKSETELAQLRAQHAGPTVREAAEADARWWTDKYAGEQP